MIQTFIVTIDSEKNIKSRDVADAINFSTGAFNLDFIYDDIIVAKARKIKNREEKK